MFYRRNVWNFALVYTAISVFVFVAMIVIWRGFPFFPEIVYKSTEEFGNQMRLPKSSYYLLYFVQGTAKIPIERQNVGNVEIYSITADGRRLSVNWKPSNFYFDDAPDGNGIRGHSIASFTIAGDGPIVINAKFRKYGYDGLVVKTGFKWMVISLTVFEFFVLIFSISVMRIMSVHKGQFSVISRRSKS